MELEHPLRLGAVVQTLRRKQDLRGVLCAVEKFRGVEGETPDVLGKLARGVIGRLEPGKNILEHTGSRARSGHELAAAGDFGGIGVCDSLVHFGLGETLHSAFRRSGSDNLEPRKSLGKTLDLSVNFFGRRAHSFDLADVI